jgi:NADPH-dependent curcumin reductase CurA
MSSQSQSSELPSQYSKILVKQLSSNFRQATEIVRVPLSTNIPPGSVLIKIIYTGINASDINYSAGKYDSLKKPPFDIGFESLGLIVQSNNKDFPVGSAVMSMAAGSFSQYQILATRSLYPVPHLDIKFLPLLVSGLTAAIALKEVGEIKSGETILITAASGGTGLFAVQLAKLAGLHVIATCGSDDKVALLKGLGADRVINYKSQDLNAILKSEYKGGVDVVYESVGGKSFDTCLRHLAIKGRLIVIGAISGYQSGEAWQKDNKASNNIPIPMQLLWKAASVRGFFLSAYTKLHRAYLKQLIELLQQGKLKSIVDKESFTGLESIASALDFMYQGKNIGKVVVKIAEDEGSSDKNSTSDATNSHFKSSL